VFFGFYARKYLYIYESKPAHLDFPPIWVNLNIKIKINRKTCSKFENIALRTRCSKFKLLYIDAENNLGPEFLHTESFYHIQSKNRIKVFSKITNKKKVVRGLKKKLSIRLRKKRYLEFWDAIFCIN